MAEFPAPTEGILLIQVHRLERRRAIPALLHTVRAECLDWLLILGRHHLERVLRVYTAHYNRERPHRALALHPPEPTTVISRPNAGTIERGDLLGGLIHEYYQAAARTEPSILKPFTARCQIDSLSTHSVSPYCASGDAPFGR